MLWAPPSLLPLLNSTPVCCRHSADAIPRHRLRRSGCVAGMADTSAAPLPRGSYFTEARIGEILRTSALRSSPKFARGKRAPDAADDGDRLKPPSQGRQDLLGAAVFAFRQRLAQLTDERAWHTVALEPAEQLLLAGGELHALQVPTHLGGQALPQEIHAFASCWPIAGLMVPRRATPTSASGGSPKFGGRNLLSPVRYPRAF